MLKAILIVLFSGCLTSCQVAPISGNNNAASYSFKYSISYIFQQHKAFKLLSVTIKGQGHFFV